MKDGDDLLRAAFGRSGILDMTAVAPRTAFLTIDFDQTT